MANEDDKDKKDDENQYDGATLQDPYKTLSNLGLPNSGEDGADDSIPFCPVAIPADNTLKRIVDSIGPKPIPDLTIPDFQGSLQQRRQPATKRGMERVSESRIRETQTAKSVIGDAFLYQGFFETFRGTFDDQGRLETSGLSLVSIRHRNVTPQTLFAIRQYCPDVICLSTLPIAGTNDHILHYVVDTEGLSAFQDALKADENVVAIETGGKETKPTLDLSGINLTGEDIVRNNKSLKEFQQDPDTDSPTLKVDHVNQKPRIPTSVRVIEEESGEMQETRCFVISLKLEGTYSTEDLHAIQSHITQKVVEESGCKIHGSGTEFFIYSSHERMEYSLPVIVKLQQYLESIGLGKHYFIKYTHGPLVVRNLTYGIVDKDDDDNIQHAVTICKTLGGKALDELSGMPDINGEIPISNLGRFSHDDRYRYWIKPKTVTYKGPNGEEMTTEVIERIMKAPKPNKRGFIGRKKEIDGIKTVLDRSKQSGPEIHLLDGVGGIGKTSLLMHALSEEDSILLKPYKGRGYLAIVDFATQLRDLYNKNPSANAEVQTSAKYIGGLADTQGKTFEDGNSFAEHALCLIDHIGEGRGKDKAAFALVFDDIDDNESESLQALVQIVSNLRKAKHQNSGRFKGVTCFITHRSDITYAEDTETRKFFTGSAVEHQTALRYIGNLLTGRTKVGPIEIGQEENGEIQASHELENFIVGKTLTKYQSGKYIDKIDTAKVGNITSFAALILRRVGQRTTDQKFVAIPHLMVQIINELLESNKIGYDPELNEVYILDYNNLDMELPLEPEGIHEKQFARMPEGNRKMAVLMCLLEGLPLQIAERITSKEFGVFDDFSFERLTNDREMGQLDGNGCIQVNIQWKNFLRKQLARSSGGIEGNNREILDQLMAFASGSQGLPKIPAKKIFELARPLIKKDPELLKIVSPYLVKAAEEAINERDYPMALECAATFLKTALTPESDLYFRAIMSIIQACVYLNRFNDLSKFTEKIKTVTSTEQQKLETAKVLLENCYLYFKHCELNVPKLAPEASPEQIKTAFGSFKTAIGQALQNYDVTLREFTPALEKTPYGQALFMHHKAQSLSVRLGRNMFSHENNGEFFEIQPETNPHQKALEMARKADEILETIPEQERDPEMKQLLVANTTLIGTISIEWARMGIHNRDNEALMIAGFNQHPETSMLLKNAMGYSHKGLVLATQLGVDSAPVKARAASIRANSTIYQGQPNPNMERLIETAITYAGFMPPQARTNLLIQLSSAIIEHCKVVTIETSDMKQYLMKILYDITGELYRQSPETGYEAYNFAETCILKAITMLDDDDKDIEKGIVELKKSLEILEKHVEKIKGLARPEYVKLVAQHLLVVMSFGERAMTQFMPTYGRIIDADDLATTTELTKTPKTTENQAGQLRNIQDILGFGSIQTIEELAKVV